MTPSIIVSCLTCEVSGCVSLVWHSRSTGCSVLHPPLALDRSSHRPSQPSGDIPLAQAVAAPSLHPHIAQTPLQRPHRFCWFGVAPSAPALLQVRLILILLSSDDGDGVDTSAHLTTCIAWFGCESPPLRKGHVVFVRLLLFSLRKFSGVTTGIHRSRRGLPSRAEEGDGWAHRAYWTRRVSVSPAPLRTRLLSPTPTSVQ